MKRTIIFALLFSISLAALAQEATDTVVINVGDGSKVIFAIKDKKDLETMKRYNFQKLMDDMIYKLEVRDSSRLNRLSSEFLKKDSVHQAATPAVATSQAEPEPTVIRKERYRGRRTRNSFNIDIG